MILIHCFHCFHCSEPHTVSSWAELPRGHGPIGTEPGSSGLFFLPWCDRRTSKVCWWSGGCWWSGATPPVITGDANVNVRSHDVRQWNVICIFDPDWLGPDPDWLGPDPDWLGPDPAWLGSNLVLLIITALKWAIIEDYMIKLTFNQIPWRPSWINRIWFY